MPTYDNKAAARKAAVRFIERNPGTIMIETPRSYKIKLEGKTIKKFVFNPV